MNENKGTSSNTLKYLLIAIGLLAVVASYMLVFNKYRTINEDLESEIESLETRRDELKAKDKNKEAVIALTEENNKKFDEVVAKFDGDLSYQAAIMDIYYHRKDDNVEINALTYTTPTDSVTFSNGFVGKNMNYVYSVTSTYDQMKDVLKYFTEYEGKRKVPNSISFAYDSNTHKITTSFNVNEYAISGEGREPLPTREPEFTKGESNIFYNQVISNG